MMQNDAVDHYHWMTDSQFLNAVALGQVTPGPVVHTVAVVGYAAAGVAGGLLARPDRVLARRSSSCSSAPDTSTRSDATRASARSSTAPDPPRSERSSVSRIPLALALARGMAVRRARRRGRPAPRASDAASCSPCCSRPPPDSSPRSSARRFPEQWFARTAGGSATLRAHASCEAARHSVTLVALRRVSSGGRALLL